MSIRDAEIQRLENYAKSLGLRVEYRTYRPGHPGAAVISGMDGKPTRLVIYVWPTKSKTQIVLDFVHELGHQVSFIYNNRHDSKELLNALYEEDQRKPGDPPLDKAKRKLIYECEKKDATYRDNIIHEMNIKVSKAKFKMDRDLDLWIYRFFYLHGDYPNREQVRAKRKFLKEKYRGQ